MAVGGTRKQKNRNFSLSLSLSHLSSPLPPKNLNLVVVELPPRLLRASARGPRAVLLVPGGPLLGRARREHRTDRESERAGGQRRGVVSAVSRRQDGEADVAVGVDVRVDGDGGEEDDLCC